MVVMSRGAIDCWLLFQLNLHFKSLHFDIVSPRYTEFVVFVESITFINGSRVNN